MEVKVPVREPIAAMLIEDCVVEHPLPQLGPLMWRDIESYTMSLETALACARGKLRYLRDAEALR